MRILLIIICFAVSSVSLNFYSNIFSFLINSFNLGWVVSDIITRFFIILFSTVGFYYLIKLIFRSLNPNLIITISVVFAFLFSFIRPIYIDDYGIVNNTKFTIQENFKEKYINNTDLSKGNIVIAFFTTSCPFCFSASYNFGVNSKNNKQPRTVVFFPGNKEDSESFLSESNVDFDYVLIDDKTFLENAGNAFPSVYLIQDGIVKYHWVGAEINYSVLDYLASLN